jgi:hypothetical protein
VIALIWMELRSIARSWPTLVLAGFLLLLEGINFDRSPAWDGQDYQFWLTSTLLNLSFWAGMVATMLAQRDARLGTLELILPSTLGRGRFIAAQFGAVLASSAVLGLLLAVVVYWKNPPENLLNFSGWKLVDLLLLNLNLAAVGLWVGRLFKNPLALILTVILWFAAATMQIAPLHTLTWNIQTSCSRILGCPDLPYIWHALFYLATASLFLLLANWASGRHPFNTSSLHRKAAATLTCLAFLGIIWATPILARAAQDYPAPSWKKVTVWPKVGQDQTSFWDTAEYRSKLYCMGNSPRVCLLRGQEKLAKRILNALLELRKLQPNAKLLDVIAFPGVGFSNEERVFFSPTALYISEHKLWAARLETITSQVTDKSGKKTVRKEKINKDFILIHSILDQVLLQKPAIIYTKSPDGGNSYQPPTLDAPMINRLYLEVMALKVDPLWTEQEMGLKSLEGESSYNNYIYEGTEAALLVVKDLRTLASQYSDSSVLKTLQDHSNSLEEMLKSNPQIQPQTITQKVKQWLEGESK